ncbi:MAG: hypothetical protein AAFX78_02615 [Cyanobacteria bacterium J06638_20]
MSKFHTPTNEGRIDKMVATVEMLDKSAKSNKASTEDIDTLVAPLLDALRELGATIGTSDRPVSAPEPTPRVVGEEPHTAPDGTPREPGPHPYMKGEYKPLWMSIKEMAEQAPLMDLGQAMVVYTQRVEDALFMVQDSDPDLVKQNKTPMPETAPVEEEDEDDDAWD